MANEKSLFKKQIHFTKKKKNLKKIKFNFNLIFKLIKKSFPKKRIAIAGYYPAYYEVDILSFLKKGFRYGTNISKVG